MTRTASLVAFFLLLLLAVFLRTVHLEADAPAVFPNGFSSSAPFKDESAKSFAPRSRILFDSWSPSPADDYRYWEKLSPVWTSMVYLWFRLFGVGYAEVRTLSVFWSAFSLLLLYLLLVRHNRLGALTAVFFGAVNFYAVIYGRLGLMETAVNTLLLAAFALQVRAERAPWYLPAAAGVWLLTWFVKQSAIVYAPVLLWGCWKIGWKGRGERRASWTPAAVTAGIFLLAFLPLFDFDYRFRTIMNFRHAMTYFPDESRLWMEISPQRTWEAVRANLTVNLVRGYFLMSPAASLLALLELVAVGRAFFQRRAEPLGVLAAFWWLACRFFITIQGQVAERFYLPQLPPTFLLAGLAAARILSWSHRFRRASIFLGVALLLELWCQVAPWEEWRRTYPRGLLFGRQELERLIGPRRAVVVGEWGPPLTFETTYQTYFLKNVFNRSREQVVAFGITHLVVAADKEDGPDIDPAVRRLRKYFPGPYEHRRELGRFPFRPGGGREEITLIVYELFPSRSAAEEGEQR